MARDSKLQNQLQAQGQNRVTGQEQAASQARRGRERSGIVSIKERTAVVTRKYVRIKVYVDRLPPPRRAKIALILDDGTAVAVEGALESAYDNRAYYKVYSRFIPVVESVADRVRETRLLGEAGQP
jgi:hypothetical protein